MGFKPKRPTFKFVDWPDDSELAGLEIRARGVPTGTLLDLMDLAAVLEGKDAADVELDPEQMRAMRELFAGFSKALVSWNIEDDDGTAVPATLEGLLGQDFQMVMTIVMTWLDVIGGIAAPLDHLSTGGRPSPVELPPMEPLSGSRAS